MGKKGGFDVAGEMTPLTDNPQLSFSFKPQNCSGYVSATPPITQTSAGQAHSKLGNEGTEVPFSERPQVPQFTILAHSGIVCFL